MRADIQKVADKVSTLRGRAEELADSENEETAARYELIVEHLDAALDALDEALEEYK